MLELLMLMPEGARLMPRGARRAALRRYYAVVKSRYIRRAMLKTGFAYVFRHAIFACCRLFSSFSAFVFSC